VSAVLEDEVLRAVARRGCPICRRLRAEERRYWFYLLYEGFQSPTADARLRDSIGFCRRHRGQLVQRRDVFALGSIALASVEGALRRLDQRPPRRPLPTRRVAASGSGCPLCASLVEVERSALETLTTLLTRDGARERYGASDGVCFDHAGLALERRLPAAQLIGAQARRLLGERREELRRLMRSFDYRQEGASPELAAAPLETLRALGGDPGRLAP
jgi:hypothetical protein